MSKIATKIYNIDSSHLTNITPKFLIESIINNHNSDISANFYQQISCEVGSENFELALYIHKPKKSRPSWYELLLEISNYDSDVKNIESKYPSFILFFYSKNEIFVITGGAGYRAIESYLDSQFGFKVVERLIDTSKDDLRGLQQRVFLGSELASNRFFKADYVFQDEDTFGKYYRGLHVFIDNEKLKNIGVDSNKKKLLVRGELGFKIDTKISFEELLNRILRISKLLKEDCEVELNPFKKLTRWELKRSESKEHNLEQILNQNLSNEQFIDFRSIDAKEIYHPNLIEYLECSTIRVKLDKKEIDIPTSQKITPRLIMGYLEIDENIYFPKFNELVHKIETWILDKDSGQKIYPTKLFNWFYGEVNHKGINYLKFENEWFYYSIKFSNDLNNRINSISQRVELIKMDNWTSDFNSESDYNDSYASKEKFIVGDGVFHRGIEIADLISWSENELIIYHVKNGINKNLRVLQSQIINSAKMISEFKTNLESNEITNYHQSLKKANEKLKNEIPNIEEFKSIFKTRNVRFIFGVATTSNNIDKEDVFNEIAASKSAVAKIAVLHSFYTINDMSMDFSFSISKIIRNPS